MNIEVTFLPEDRTVSVRPGTTILGAAALARIVIRSRCGGKGGCLMCKVEARTKTAGQAASLMPPGELELRKLGSAAVKEGTRLACQAKVITDTVVTTPEDPLKAAIRKQLNQTDDQDLFDW